MTQNKSFVKDIGSFYSFSNPDLDVIEMCGTSISVNINVELRKNVSTTVFLLVFLFCQLYFSISQNYFIFTSLSHLISRV
jgi:hypothetical protein